MHDLGPIAWPTPSGIKPFTRDTARPHLSRMIRQHAKPEVEPIKLLSITDEGVFLGELECGPFITYYWLAEHCVFNVDDKPCGIVK